MTFIATLKQKRWKKNSSQAFYRVIWTLYNSYRFAFIPAYRSRIIHSLLYKKEYHQFSNFTKIDRYPDLFEMAKRHFDKIENPKILSFGCSTGEEVASLSRYIPYANIVGVDINFWCLKEARRHFSSKKCTFIHSLSPDFENMQDFDAIFCLAVFQHPKNRHDKTRIESAYPFEQFEQQLYELDKKLKSEGLLFIDQCDFNFLETKLMSNYKIAPFEGNQISRQRPIF
jgi:tRNA G46 methylase TrmB